MSTKRLTDTPADIGTAAAILAQGGLVAFPTETVFGLGADAHNPQAVASIYAAKGRPSFNPLIVHVADVAMAQRYVHWTDTAQQVAQAFWPGPLTLVLPMRDDAGLAPAVTAGLPSVAIRVPRHPIAQTVLRSLGRGIAAPSANPSGKISPTQAEHVIQGLDGKIDAVIATSLCDEGLESTILSLLETPTILRPGTITQTQLANVLGTPPDHQSVTADGDSSADIQAPGQLLSHYAPNGVVRLNATTWQDDEKRLGFGDVACDLNLSPKGDLREAAANLFTMLHQIDKLAGDKIAVSPIPQTGLGLAINDRLMRAAAPKPS
jgi:L-threonylcarbamoyladenylate synthase